MSEEARVSGEVLLITIGVLWILFLASIFISPILYKWIPIIWDCISSKIKECIGLFYKNLGKGTYMNNNNCNLITCRYNQSGNCMNEEKRKECVEVSKRVLCLEGENNATERD